MYAIMKFLLTLSNYSEYQRNEKRNHKLQKSRQSTIKTQNRSKNYEYGITFDKCDRTNLRITIFEEVVI